VVGEDERQRAVLVAQRRVALVLVGCRRVVVVAAQLRHGGIRPVNPQCSWQHLNDIQRPALQACLPANSSYMVDGLLRRGVEEYGYRDVRGDDTGFPELREAAAEAPELALEPAGRIGVGSDQRAPASREIIHEHNVAEGGVPGEGLDGERVRQLADEPAGLVVGDLVILSELLVREQRARPPQTVEVGAIGETEKQGASTDGTEYVAAGHGAHSVRGLPQVFGGSTEQSWLNHIRIGK